jgi:hypothetical protein
MSYLTAEGRQRKRDYRRERVSQALRKEQTLKHLPDYQRTTLSELKVVGRYLYEDIQDRGVMLPNGEVNPAVEAHRKNAHEQLYSLSVFTELNRTDQTEPTDIVAMIATGAELETVESAESPEHGAPPEEPSLAER